MQGENERQWKTEKREREHVRHFLQKTCKKFLEDLRCSRVKQRQRNEQKKWAACEKLLFC